MILQKSRVYCIMAICFLLYFFIYFGLNFLPLSRHYNFIGLLTPENTSIYDFEGVKQLTICNLPQDITTFLYARSRGFSLEQIANNVFNITFPNFSSNRSHSFPFLSGDTLRAWSDIIFERNVKTYSFVFHKNIWKQSGKNCVKNGCVIFVRTDDVEDFAREIHPTLTHRYILITHNSGYSIPRGPFSRKILDDSKLIRWFGQNVGFDHVKLEAVPIGLQNRVWKKAGVIENYEPFLNRFCSVYCDKCLMSKGERRGEKRRDIQLYFNFNIENNPQRREALLIVKPDFGFTVKVKLNQNQYLAHLERSMFVVSPPGTGEDCHRTWEAVLLGAIPIVRNSSLRSLYRNVPSLVIDSWDEVTPERLDQFRPLTTNRDIITAKYWFNRISSFRDRQT